MFSTTFSTGRTHRQAVTLFTTLLAALVLTVGTVATLVIGHAATAQAAEPHPAPRASACISVLCQGSGSGSIGVIGTK